MNAQPYAVGQLMAVMTLLLFDIASVRLARDQPLLLYSIVPFAVLSNGFLPTLVEPFQLAFVACGQSVGPCSVRFLTEQVFPKF